jgi:hypothetical protein
MSHVLNLNQQCLINQQQLSLMSAHQQDSPASVTNASHTLLIS